MGVTVKTHREEKDVRESAVLSVIESKNSLLENYTL